MIEKKDILIAKAQLSDLKKNFKDTKIRVEQLISIIKEITDLSLVDNDITRIDVEKLEVFFFDLINNLNKAKELQSKIKQYEDTLNV